MFLGGGFFLSFFFFFFGGGIDLWFLLGLLYLQTLTVALTV